MPRGHVALSSEHLRRFSCISRRFVQQSKVLSWGGVGHTHLQQRWQSRSGVYRASHSMREDDMLEFQRSSERALSLVVSLSAHRKCSACECRPAQGCTTHTLLLPRGQLAVATLPHDKPGRYPNISRLLLLDGLLVLTVGTEITSFAGSKSFLSTHRLRVVVSFSDLTTRKVLTYRYTHVFWIWVPPDQHHVIRSQVSAKSGSSCGAPLTRRTSRPGMSRVRAQHPNVGNNGRGFSVKQERCTRGQPARAPVSSNPWWWALLVACHEDAMRRSAHLLVYPLDHAQLLLGQPTHNTHCETPFLPAVRWRPPPSPPPNNHVRVCGEALATCDLSTVSAAAAAFLQGGPEAAMAAEAETEVSVLPVTHPAFDSFIQLDRRRSVTFTTCSEWGEGRTSRR